MASSSITARNQATKPVTLLSAIDGNKDNLKILVRIFSLWKPCEANKAPFAIELVLSDTQGTKIGASLKRSLFYKFEKDLCEGVSYYMCNMGSEANKGLYRSTSHSRKLVFKRESSIKRVDVDMVPPSAYAFTEPSTIWQPTFDTSYLIDVIGVLTGASEQYPYKSKGVESVLCIIDLNNKG